MEKLIERKFVNPGLEAQVLRALAHAGADAVYRYVDLLPEAAFPTYRDAYLKLLEATDKCETISLDELPEAEASTEEGFDLEAGARKLAELAQSRLTAKAIAKLWTDLGTGVPAGEAIARAQEALAEAARAVKELAAGRTTTMGDLLSQAEKDVAEKAKLLAETGRPSPHPTFGPDLKTTTELLGGLQPGVFALGGEPGLGKTFLALTWAHRYLQAEKDTGVVWVDCGETRPLHLIAIKFACINARKNPYLFERGLCNPKEFTAIARASSVFGSRFEVIDATENISTAHIRAVIRKLQARTGAKRVMVVVDYVQKLAQFAMGGEGDVRQRVMRVVASLTRLVEVANGPVVLISALSKDAYRRKVADASISDFRESGDVEYTADVGIQLRWASDERNSEKDSAVKVLDMHIVKNRYGPGGTVRLYSIRTEARYTEDDPGNIKMPSLSGLGTHDEEPPTVSDATDDDLPF